MSPMSTTFSKVQLLRAAALVALAFVWSTSADAATMRFDNGGGDGLWETADNWDEVTNPNTLPGTADTADISNSHTTSISSAQTITELIVGWPNGAAGTTAGTATLNILPNTNLQNDGSTGMRIGRALKAAHLVGSSKGIVNQTGGLVQINNTSQGLRLSAGDNGNVADSYYRISGGSLVAVSGTQNNAIQVGNTGSNYASAEFHVVGSGVTEIRTDDFRMQGNATGSTVLHFSLDDGGVTPIIADDEMRFVGVSGVTHNTLVVDLIGLPPMTDILLISADRLNQSGGIEAFTGLPQGSAISAGFGPPREHYTYNWTIDYRDDGDDGDHDAHVKLLFVSRTFSIPEPASCLLLVLGGVFMLVGRRRGC